MPDDMISAYLENQIEGQLFRDVLASIIASSIGTHER